MAELLVKAGKAIGGYLVNKATNSILKPIDQLVDQNLSDISTTFGSFIIRSIRGKLQRSITFEVGLSYYDRWLEEALYGILYEWNDIKSSSRLELQNRRTSSTDMSAVYCKLGDGFHNLKYRNWDIMLSVQSKAGSVTPGGRMMPAVTMYTIISYDLSPEFVKCFEQDMLRHRNSILKISADSPMLNIYTDAHESDGYTYWEKSNPVYKRKLSTIYLPKDQIRTIVNTVNEFFAMKQFYIDNGIPHNLKILFYGPPGVGKAQPLSTPIPTPDGWKTMGDLKVGDEVFTDDGSATTIDGVFPRGILKVFELTFSDGRKTRCSLDHLWKVRKLVKGKVTSDWEIMSLRMIIDISETSNNISFEIPRHTGFIKINNPNIENMNELLQAWGHEEDDNSPLIMDSAYFIGEEQCQCIHVTSPSHLYVTDQFIVTHNTSLAKMIASEWNRNLYECTGGKNGKFIPNAITDYDEGIISPLFSISDIDKYPTLINEADTDMSNKEDKKSDEQLAYKQQFNNMINALDGVMTGEDRIIVMTTNHIEKFSEAFLRPGRIDLLMKIDYVQPGVFRKFVYDFYKMELPKDIKLVRKDITISEMQRDIIFMKLTADEFIKKYIG